MLRKIFALFLFASGGAVAAPVQYQFSVGNLEEFRVNEVALNTYETVAATPEQQLFADVGSFSGTFWYDAEAAAVTFCSVTSSVGSCYLNTITDLQGTLGGNSFSVANSGLDIYGSDTEVPGSPIDYFRILALGSPSPFPQEITQSIVVSDGQDEFEFFEFEALFTNSSAGEPFYEPGGLPARLIPEGADVAWLQMNFRKPETDTSNPAGNVFGDHQVRGTLTVQVVPVPAAVWLFGSALAGLGWVSRRRFS